MSFTHSTLCLDYLGLILRKEAADTREELRFIDSLLLICPYCERYQNCMSQNLPSQSFWNHMTHSEIGEHFYQSVCPAKICLRGCRLSTVETWVISHNRTSVARGQPPQGRGQCGAWPGRLSRRAQTGPCETHRLRQ